MVVDPLRNPWDYHLGDADADTIKRWIPTFDPDNANIAALEALILTTFRISPTETQQLTWPQIIAILRHRNQTEMPRQMGLPVKDPNGQAKDEFADVAREVAIREFSVFAARFESIGDTFRKTVVQASTRAGVVAELQLMEEAGVLLVDCARRGWLGGIPGLDELIAWFDGEDSGQDHKRVATLVRSPHNVFIEVVGGNTIDVKNTGDELVLVSDPKGGLLPAVFPALFPPVRYLRAAVGASGMEAKEFKRLESLARYERYAKTCRILADLLSTPGSTEAPSSCVVQEGEEKTIPGNEHSSTPTSPRTDGYELFYSFSTEDERLRSQLETHLAMLKRENLIREWNFREIPPGAHFKNEIDKHLNTASIILLLVSADFLASEYCYTIEMKRAMERHEQHNAVVIPIILRPCEWDTAPFANLEALPNDGKPVTSWRNKDEAFTDIAKGIRRMIKSQRFQGRFQGQRPQ